MILEILGVSCFIVLFINAEPKKKIEEYFGIYNYPMIDKLFNCAMCFGTWFSLFYFLLTIGLSINLIPLVGLTSVCAELINREINRIIL